MLVKHIAVLKFVDKETAKKRYDVCMTCEFQKNKKCVKCGCFILAKTKLNTECPENKW